VDCHEMGFFLAGHGKPTIGFPDTLIFIQGYKRSACSQSALIRASGGVKELLFQLMAGKDASAKRK